MTNGVDCENACLCDLVTLRLKFDVLVNKVRDVLDANFGASLNTVTDVDFNAQILFKALDICVKELRVQHPENIEEIFQQNFMPSSHGSREELSPRPNATQMQENPQMITNQAFMTAVKSFSESSGSSSYSDGEKNPL